MWKLCFRAVCCVSVAQGCPQLKRQGCLMSLQGVCTGEWASSGSAGPDHVADHALLTKLIIH